MWDQFIFEVAVTLYMYKIKVVETFLYLISLQNLMMPVPLLPHIHKDERNVE